MGGFPRCALLIADWSNVLAGITLILSFYTYFQALQLHHCGANDTCTRDNQGIIFWGKKGSHTTYEFATWTMFLEGVFWCLAGCILAGANIAANVASLAASQTLIAIGGFFFMCSSWGSPANIISLRYLIPYERWDATGTVPTNYVSFADACPFYGITCFMIATAICLWSVRGAPKSSCIGPFYGVLCFFLGAWIIGLVTLWIPMLAGGFTKYEDVSMPPCKGDKRCILDMPIIKWYQLKIWTLVGAAFLTLGGIIFGIMDKFWICGEPESANAADEA